ncbi:hypothetical protein ACFY83_05795 [Streptomyces althioticus]|uniref:hypothetical protein n=1 Tax=Streptomyces althioticus TaxID=83380 RepID=UPI0036E35D4D
MATGKPQLLFVHGIGRLRDTATDRRRWLEALAAGTRDANMAEVISALTQGWLADVTFANYSDLFNRRGAQGHAAGELDEYEVSCPRFRGVPEARLMILARRRTTSSASTT